MIPPVGIFAAMVYYDHGFVRLPVVGFISAGFMVGAFLGAKLVPHLPLEVLRMVLGILLVYLGTTFIFSPRGTVPGAALPAGLAMLFAAAVAWLRRRQPPDRKALQPPTDDQGYYI